MKTVSHTALTQKFIAIKGNEKIVKQLQDATRANQYITWHKQVLRLSTAGAAGACKGRPSRGLVELSRLKNKCLD